MVRLDHIRGGDGFEALPTLSVSHLPNRLVGVRAVWFWYECKMKSKNGLLGLFQDFDADLYFYERNMNIKPVYTEIRLYRKRSVLCIVIFYVYPMPVLIFVLSFELYVCLHRTFFF